MSLLPEFLLILSLKVRKPKIITFGLWTKLEELTAKAGEAVGTKISEFPELIISYVSTVSFFPRFILNNLYWESAIKIYFLAIKMYSPNKIPMLISEKKEKKRNVNSITKKYGWEYTGRDKYYYQHLLASSYGWELQYINNLDINIALPHIQEILTTTQLDREFLWSMSEIAYPYNSTTKESKFSPLARPYFMEEVAGDIKKVKILKSMLPAGVINDTSGMEKYFQGKETKEIELVSDSEGL